MAQCGLLHIEDTVIRAIEGMEFFFSSLAADFTQRHVEVCARKVLPRACHLGREHHGKRRGMPEACGQCPNASLRSAVAHLCRQWGSD
jgi:hypothetical protein